MRDGSSAAVSIFKLLTKTELILMIVFCFYNRGSRSKREIRSQHQECAEDGGRGWVSLSEMLCLCVCLGASLHWRPTSHLRRVSVVWVVMIAWSRRLK